MNTRTVTLTKPVPREAGPITAVTLREPMAGDLRGLKLIDVMAMDVATMSRLIPRVSEPGLAPDEVAALPGADLVTLAVAVVGFFANEEQIAEQEQQRP